MTISQRSAPRTPKPAMRKQPEAVTQSRTSIVTLLKRDHAEVKAMYKEFEALVDDQAPAKQRQALATQIVTALKAHAELEESVFYPSAREVLSKEDSELVNHADVEHRTAKDLIAKIESMHATDKHFDATVCVLCEYVDHHVKEEEKELFPACKMAGIDERALGQLALAWKQKHR